MNYNSLIKNQTYLFESEEDLFSQNNELILKIFEDSNLEKPLKIEFYTSNTDYDIFNISCENNNYILKFSLDEFNSSLKYEFDIIKKLSLYTTLVPVSYNKFKFGDSIHYSIYLDSKNESIKNFGLSSISSNIGKFVDSYFNLQKSTILNKKHSELMIKFLKNHSISFFDKDIIEAISKNTNLDIIKEVVESLNSEILLLFQSEIFNKQEFCHGDLNQSNILYCFNHFKFINLCNSFSGNLYFDLASLVINCGFNKNIEKKLFDSFVKNKKANLIGEEWAEYKKCFDLTLRKIFLEMLFNFFKEIYLFESARPAKLLEIIETFSQNQNNFLKIPVINKNFKLIYDLFLQPLIGSEEKVD